MRNTIDTITFHKGDGRPSQSTDLFTETLADYLGFESPPLHPLSTFLKSKSKASSKIEQLIAKAKRARQA